MRPAGPALLGPLKARWETVLPALRGPLPEGWSGTLRALSDRFNRIEGAPEGDYFSAANVEPYFAHHGWAQAEALAAIATETPLQAPGTVWDLGGGPGVLTAAASVLWPGAAFTLTDLRDEALSWAASKLAPLGVEVRIKRQRLPELPEGQPDLVMLGHVLNELPERDQLRLIAGLKERLASGGRLLILEPALRATTRRLMTLREDLRAAPFTLQAPCPCLGPCPMLPLDRQWCVAELPWEPPAWFRELDAGAGLDRRMLSFAYLLAQKDGTPRLPRARVVGVPKAQKGKVERWMCLPGGGERWEALSRHGEPAWAGGRGLEVEPSNAGELKAQPEGWPVRRFRP